MVTAAVSAEITVGGRLDCGPKIDPFCLGLSLGASANFISEPVAPRPPFGGGPQLILFFLYCAPPPLGMTYFQRRVFDHVECPILPLPFGGLCVADSVCLTSVV